MPPVHPATPNVKPPYGAAAIAVDLDAEENARAQAIADEAAARTQALVDEAEARAQALADIAAQRLADATTQDARDDAEELALSQHAADATLHNRNVELGYAETNQNQQVASSATSNVATTIVPLVVTVTVGARPIMVNIEGQIQPGQAATIMYVSLWEDGVQISEWSNYQATAFGLTAFARSKRRTPAAGNHTYQVKLRSGAANQSVAIGPGPGDVSFIQVVEV